MSTNDESHFLSHASSAGLEVTTLVLASFNFAMWPMLLICDQNIGPEAESSWPEAHEEDNPAKERLAELLWQK